MMQRTYSDYVRGDRVHSRIFTDPEIFEDELERIFYRSWLYVGHESEIAEPGDYRLKSVGRQSVIMARDEDERVHVFMNRCRHRGSAVCQQEKGNSSYFRCPYHGWTYRNSGELTGVPLPDGYGDDFDKSSMGLTPVPRLDSYRGFYFASLDPSVDELAEFLGSATTYIDAFVDASPTGTVRLTAGCLKTLFRGNWKYVGMDGYHINFTHKSVIMLRRNFSADGDDDGRQGTFGKKSPSQTVDLGNGHLRLDKFAGKMDADYEELAGPLMESEAGRRYLQLLEDAYGTGRTKELLVTSPDPHLAVWPNVQWISSHVRVIRPVAPDLTEVYLYPALLDGVPDEINEERLRRFEWFFGPAGFGQPDDSEIFERNHLGLQCEVNPWLLLSRGAGREETTEDGATVGHISDEVTQRAQMRTWLKAMGG